MPNPAVTADIEARFRPLTPLETVNAEALLGDAWEILLSRRLGLESQVESGAVTPSNIIRVVSAMVIRVLRNPGGYLEESIDDYRYRRDAVISTGLLHVTADELSDITPRRPRRNSVRLVVYGDA